MRQMWDEAEAAEQAYANYILHEPVLGYNADDHIEQFRFIANRRARQLGFVEPFRDAKCALPWLLVPNHRVTGRPFWRIDQSFPTKLVISIPGIHIISVTSISMPNCEIRVDT